MCERWIGDWINCNILTLSSFVFSSTSFPFCWAAQSEVLMVHSLLLGAGSHYSILSPTLTDSKLTEPVCGPGLYNCLTSTCFLWASHLHPIQPVHSQGYTLISSTGCTSSLIDGWVEGQYVTGFLWHISPYGLFNVISCLYINIYICVCVCVCVCNLWVNCLLVWFLCLMAYQPL